jgi:hypothetical protein
VFNGAGEQWNRSAESSALLRLRLRGDMEVSRVCGWECIKGEKQIKQAMHMHMRLHGIEGDHEARKRTDRTGQR